jgi:hypothetical protein
MERPTRIHMHWGAPGTNMLEDFPGLCDEWKV